MTATTVDKGGMSFETETERIRESRRTEAAKRRHRFQAAHWTHPNGHPRCRICGDEERVGGWCEPASRVSKARRKQVSREYLEETVTLTRQYLPQWLWQRVQRLARAKAGGRRSAEAAREVKRTAEGLAELMLGAPAVFAEPEKAMSAGWGETHPMWPWVAETAKAVTAIVEPRWMGRRALFVKRGEAVAAPEGFEGAIGDLPHDVVACGVVLDVPEEYGRVAALFDILHDGQKPLVGKGYVRRRRALEELLGTLPAGQFRTTRWLPIRPNQSAARQVAQAARALVDLPHLQDGIVVKHQLSDATRGEGVCVLKQGAFQIQTVVFPKTKWTAARAKAWLRDHNFRSAGMDETPSSFRFRQRDPGDFERIRPVCLTPPGARPRLEDCRVMAFGGPLAAQGVGRSVRLLKQASELQQVTGVVMEPEETDAHGDVTSHDEIQQAAHQFAMDYRRGRTRLRLQHSEELADEDAVLIENYVTPHDMEIGGQHVKLGSWVQTWQILSKALWSRIKLGLVTGFSIGGLARKRPA